MGTRQLLTAVDAKLVQVTVTAARPTTAVDGVDIRSWRTNGFFSSQMASCELDGSVALTLTSPTDGTKGVEIWGYRGVSSKWRRLGYLNDGEAIDVISATQGYGTEVDLIGIYDRIAICGTPSAGVATATLTPIEVWS